MSRIAVTGANGFLGSSLVARLARSGHQVRALSRCWAASSAARGVEGRSVDLFEPRGLAAALEGCDAVVHCAGGIDGDLAALRRLNVEGARAIARASRAASVRRCVQLSSLAVYARQDREWIDESCPLVQAGHPYNVSKAEAELALIEAAGGELELVRLRLGAVLGVHPSSFWGVRMPELIRARQLRLRADGEDHIPWVQIGDLLGAIELVLREPRAAGRAFNLVDEHGTWRSYTDEVRGWFGVPELERIPLGELAPGEYWRGQFVAGALRALGHAPAHTLAEGLTAVREFWVCAAPRVRRSPWEALQKSRLSATVRAACR
jgi:nucleoside-diphosphate-sugar epimerase